MIRAVAFLALLLPSLAAAQPVMFKLDNNVAEGKKPTLTVTAVVRVSDLVLDLTRDEDGGKVTVRNPGLRPNQSVTFSIGDGTAGRAHYKGTLTMKMADGEWQNDLTFETIVLAPLKVNYQYDHLDLDKRSMEFQLTRPAKSAELTVVGDDGRDIGQGSARYDDNAPGAWLPIHWTQSGGNAMVLQLRVTDISGFSINVKLSPWSLPIAHQEVSFPTGSAVIEAAERPKLDEAFAQIVAASERVKKFVKCTLFISGHTDTVGSRDSNHKLSVERARSIALYFKQKGLALPISYDGFGEEQLKVKTPDETDEPQNRRVDYVLSSREPPAGAEWKEAR